MPLEAEFVSDCLYYPDGLLIDEVLEVDIPNSLVRVRMPTHEDLPLTRTQRVDPVIHPRHVSGGLMVHMTGVAAFAHFYYVLGLRHSQRWTGYGVRIQDARFHALAKVGPPLILQCKALRTRKRGHHLMVQYEFHFYQDEKLVYEGQQAAMWMKVPDGHTVIEAVP
jgi:3-hydroxymyristoyl/3-hydroxydecanoyl-(acyl carrier protein) dehydratase